MHRFVIEGEPLLQSGVDSAEGMGNGRLAVEELVADPAKKSFDFTTAAGFPWWSMDKMDTESGTDKFQMVAGITGAVVGVET